MDNKNYESFEFKRLPRIPRRFLWQAGWMLAVRLLWGIIPQSGHFWLVLVVVNILAWMASYGRRMAMLDLHNLVERISQEVGE